MGLRRPMKALLSFAVLSLALVACGTPRTLSNDVDASTPDAATPDASTPRDAGAQVGPADVSVAFPLPDSLPATELLSGTAMGAFGPLVDPAPFGLVPPLDAHSAGSAAMAGEAARAELRLVAVRFDPCFGPADGSACRAQMRLVFQGLELDSSGRVGASDGAVHVFVELSAHELEATIRELLKLNAASGGYTPGPLGVHPILKREGLGGPFATGLKQLILSHAGASRSSRMTFFVLLGAGAPTWSFGIFDKVGAAYQQQNIATVAQPQQRLTNSISFGGKLSATVTNPTLHVDSVLVLLDTQEAMAKTPAERQHAFDAALRIENPRTHTADTIDCVGCHTATPVVRGGEMFFGLSQAGNANRFTSPAPPALAHPEAATINNIHAFSYLGEELAISARTANETAVVVEAMNALLAK